MEQIERRSPRLKGFDYNAPGVYFVTVCTCKMRMLFWENPMCLDSAPVEGKLNFAGKIADEIIRALPDIFEVKIEKYVIMPNHIHMLIFVTERSVGNGANAMLCRIVGYAKRKISLALREKGVDEIIWQRSFYDHIVRNEEDYKRIWKYIENNPIKWEKDRFYNECNESN